MMEKIFYSKESEGLFNYICETNKTIIFKKQCWIKMLI